MSKPHPMTANEEREAIVGLLRARADQFTLGSYAFCNPLRRFRSRWIAAGLKFTAREIEQGAHLSPILSEGESPDRLNAGEG